MPCLTESPQDAPVVTAKQVTSTSRSRLVSAWDVLAFRYIFAGTGARVLAPGDKGYDKSLERWSKAAEKPSGVSVQPSNEDEVAIAVKFAAEQGFDLAVKGGGHSTAGASSTDGGVLIDLTRMRNVRVDTETNLIHIQGGAQWGNVDNAAWEHGLATVGGTVADTGVGGLTLGGGYGMLTGEYGLVIDNLVQAIVVLANGEIKIASKTENPDLFWALQGAGQNFGVTTEFVLQGYPQKEVFVGTMVFPPSPDVTTKLVAAINDLYTVTGELGAGSTSKSNGKTMGLLGISTPPHGGPPVLMYVAIYNGPEEEGRRVHKPFLDLNPVYEDMRMAPYPTVNNLIPAATDMRSSMKGASFKLPIKEEIVGTMLDEYDRLLTFCPDGGQSLIAWELMDPSKIVAGTAGCFANRGHHLNAVVMPMWKQASDDATCRQWARDLSDKFKSELELNNNMTRTSQDSVMLYGNYDQYDERSRDIFGSSYPRLQVLKAQYDPLNIFNKLFAITPETSD